MLETERERLTPTERALTVYIRLAAGERLTTAQVACIANVAPSTAWRILMRLALITPLAMTDGEWYLLEPKR